MVRSLANSLLSLLVMATFMWGGCVSCEQYFMFPGKQQKSCCNKSGQCERPSKTPAKPEKQDCNRLPFGRNGNPQPVPAPDSLPVNFAEPVLPLLPPTFIPVADRDVLLAPSPPDFQALNSVFLI